MKRQMLLLLLVLLAVMTAGCQEEATPTPAATSAPAHTPTAEAARAEVELVRVENKVMGLSVLVPEGWQVIAPGVYARGESATDLTTLIQQAAPGMAGQALATSLRAQLGIDVLPEPAATLQAGAFEWTLYEITVDVPPTGAVNVDLAMAETESATYLVLLQVPAGAYPVLHEAVFLPALEGLTTRQGGEDDSEESRSLQEDPEGRITIPRPPAGARSRPADS